MSFSSQKGFRPENGREYAKMLRGFKQGVWLGAGQGNLKVSSNLVTDFRICFYSPAWLLYWPEYIWGFFSSSKVIWRQPHHLPKELLVGSVNWSTVELTCMLYDSLCSIDAPKHVYHHVCCSKMTLLFPTCANTTVKNDAWPAIPSPECRQRAHTL